MSQELRGLKKKKVEYHLRKGDGKEKVRDESAEWGSIHDKK